MSLQNLMSTSQTPYKVRGDFWRHQSGAPYKLWFIRCYSLSHSLSTCYIDCKNGQKYRKDGNFNRTTETEKITISSLKKYRFLSLISKKTVSILSGTASPPSLPLKTSRIFFGQPSYNLSFSLSYLKTFSSERQENCIKALKGLFVDSTVISMSTTVCMCVNLFDDLRGLYTGYRLSHCSTCSFFILIWFCA